MDSLRLVLAVVISVKIVIEKVEDVEEILKRCFVGRLVVVIIVTDLAIKDVTNRKRKKLL